MTAGSHKQEWAMDPGGASFSPSHGFLPWRKEDGEGSTKSKRWEVNESVSKRAGKPLLSLRRGEVVETKVAMPEG